MSSATEAELRLAAMNALARREHSRLELQRKISARFAGCESVLDAVLDRLATEGLQSDRRFAESYSRSRIGRGYGSLHILQGLKEKGVSPQCCEEALAVLDVNWLQQAREVLAKRFGSAPPEDYPARVKRMRFLQYRGFSSEQIRQALESGCAETP